MLLLDRSVTPEQFLRLDTYELASEEVQRLREQSCLTGMAAKRTDWETEEVKQ
jgi:hypothetical protein